VLLTNGEGDLGEKTTNLDVDDAPDELIASTDAAESAAPLFNGAGRSDAGQQAIHFHFRYAVMPTGGLSALELALIDPLLQRGIADSQHLSSISRGVELRHKRSSSTSIPKPGGRWQF